MSHINLGRFQKTDILKKIPFFKSFVENPSLPCILFRNRLSWLGSTYCQALIYTGFHRFTGIGPIFHNTFLIKKKLSKLQGFIQSEWNFPISCLNVAETQERGL